MNDLEQYRKVNATQLYLMVNAKLKVTEFSVRLKDLYI